MRNLITYIQFRFLMFLWNREDCKSVTRFCDGKMAELERRINSLDLEFLRTRRKYLLFFKGGRS